MRDTHQYFYDPEYNEFSDECCKVVRNIYKFISPNLIYLFKTKKKDLFVYGLNGELIELIYLPF